MLPAASRRVLRIPTVCLPLLLLTLVGTRSPDRILAADRAPRPASDTAAASVRAELVRYYRDLSTRNWSRYADHFWPNGTLTTDWQPPGERVPRVVVSTVEEFIRQAPAGPDSKTVFEERMTAVDVKVVNNLAQAWSHYTARFGNPGALRTSRGVDAFTLMRHGGRWRITSLAYTDTR